MPVVVGNGGSLAGHLVLHRLAHHNQAIGVAEGKWLEQNRVDHAEDRSSRTDAQGKGKDGSEREAGRLAQLTNRIADVARGLFEPRQAALDAIALADLRDAAKGAQSGVARLRFIHPSRAIFFDGQLDVRAQLFIELFIELLVAEECCATAKENPDPVHNRLLIRRSWRVRSHVDRLPID